MIKFLTLSYIRLKSWITINKVFPLSLFTNKISKTLSFESFSSRIKKLFGSVKFVNTPNKVNSFISFPPFKCINKFIYLTKSFILLDDSNYTQLNTIHFFPFFVLMILSFTFIVMLLFYDSESGACRPLHSHPASKRLFTNSGIPI